MLALEITGDIPEIIGNEENLYEGNLILYFCTLFYNANNLKNPYHNFRHTLHVLWLCQTRLKHRSGERYIASMPYGSVRRS